jgi:hypothetical protein
MNAKSSPELYSGGHITSGYRIQSQRAEFVEKGLSSLVFDVPVMNPQKSLHPCPFARHVYTHDLFSLTETQAPANIAPPRRHHFGRELE